MTRQKLPGIKKFELGGKGFYKITLSDGRLKTAILGLDTLLELFEKEGYTNAQVIQQIKADQSVVFRNSELTPTRFNVVKIDLDTDFKESIESEIDVITFT